MNQRFNAVAFDLDNTLINRNAAARAVLDEWLPDESRLEEVIARDQCGQSPRREFFSWLKSEFPALEGDLWDRFQESIIAKIHPDAQISAFLESLQRAGYYQAILTNGGSDLQRAKITAAAIDSIIPPELCLISAEIGYEKPDRRAFGSLIERLDLPPNKILFVGDQPVIDIAGAKNCGLCTCLVGRRAAEMSSADYVVEYLTDLRTILL